MTKKKKERKKRTPPADKNLAQQLKLSYQEKLIKWYKEENKMKYEIAGETPIISQETMLILYVMVSINSSSIGLKILNSTTSTSRRYTWLENTYPAELEAGSEPGSSLTDHLCRTCTANTRNIVMQLQKKKETGALSTLLFFFWFLLK